jgi:hypothetical protein
MDKLFKIGLLVGIFAAAIALFQNSQNGRYRYSANPIDPTEYKTSGVVIDTRTGEYWTEDGTHFEPRTAHITAHRPFVDDETANDDSTKKFHDCLMANIQAVRTHAAQRDCVANRSSTSKQLRLPRHLRLHINSRAALASEFVNSTTSAGLLPSSCSSPRWLARVVEHTRRPCVPSLSAEDRRLRFSTSHFI